jgi:hypothetical protein
VIVGEAIDATNSRGGKGVVIYKNSENDFFVREKNEFVQKFTYI